MEGSTNSMIQGFIFNDQGKENFRRAKTKVLSIASFRHSKVVVASLVQAEVIVLSMVVNGPTILPYS